MTTQLTNLTQIPLPLAVYLATDHYDFDPSCISATALLKPARQTILKNRVPQESTVIDISSLVQSRIGTSIHDGIEKAWSSHYEKALQDLGYLPELIDSIRINPDPETVTADEKPVYMEQRLYRSIEVRNKTYKISGKVDFIGMGVLQDFKTTGAFTYKHDTKVDDYKLQGSIYRWIMPHLITEGFMKINYVFTDWAKFKVKQEKNYPPHRCMSQDIPLLSLEETEAFIRSKIIQVLDQYDMPEEEITHCTDEELWREADTFKYYKNPANAGVEGKRSTKNFTNAQEAQQRFVEDGSVGKVLHVKGRVKACNYCAGFHACTQKDEYIQDGTLVVER